MRSRIPRRHDNPASKGIINIIAGGLDQTESSGSSKKRTRDERDYCMAVKVIRRMTLAFLEDDLPIDETGSNAPLVITARMAGYEV